MIAASHEKVSQFLNVGTRDRIIRYECLISLLVAQENWDPIHHLLALQERIEIKGFIYIDVSANNIGGRSCEECMDFLFNNFARPTPRGAEFQHDQPWIVTEQMKECGAVGDFTNDSLRHIPNCIYFFE